MTTLRRQACVAGLVISVIGPLVVLALTWTWSGGADRGRDGGRLGRALGGHHPRGVGGQVAVEYDSERTPGGGQGMAEETRYGGPILRSRRR